MGPPAPERSSASRLGQIAIARRLRDPQRPADVLDRVRRVAMEQGGVPLLLVVELAGPAALPPAGPRRGETREGSLPDDVPLDFGQGPEDVEDELAAAARRVDGLLHALEAHPAVAQVGDRLDEVPQRPPEAIELPDHEPIAGPQVGQGPLQAGPLGPGPAGLVSIDLLAPRGLQGIFLEVEVLIEGRDPGVAGPHRVGLPAAPRSPPGPVSQIPGVWGSRETLKSRRVRETRIGRPGRLAHRRPAGLI